MNGKIIIILSVNILSRASEAGSPTNPPWAPGSDKTRGQESFGPFTGGLYKNLKKKRTVHLIRFLLRQGESGTSRYIKFSTYPLMYGGPFVKYNIFKEGFHTIWTNDAFTF